MITLAECAELLLDAPNCRAFLDAWLRWREEERVPSVDAVRPEELGKAINAMSVIEVRSRDEITFRLISPLHADVTRRELKDLRISDITTPENRQVRMERLWTIASTPCGAMTNLTYARPSGVNEPVRRLLLPVMPQASNDPKRLYIAMDRYGEPGQMDDLPEHLVAVTHELTYVDIGCGTPE